MIVFRGCSKPPNYILYSSRIGLHEERCKPSALDSPQDYYCRTL